MEARHHDVQCIVGDLGVEVDVVARSLTVYHLICDESGWVVDLLAVL